MRLARAIALGCLATTLACVAPVAAADDAAIAPVAPEEAHAPADGPYATSRRVWDALVLRPLGFVQVVAGTVVFPVAWPIAASVDAMAGSDYADDVRVACIDGPVAQTFTRPLGE